MYLSCFLRWRCGVALCVFKHSHNVYDVSTKYHSRLYALRMGSPRRWPHTEMQEWLSIVTITLKLSLTDIITHFFVCDISLKKLTQETGRIQTLALLTCTKGRISHNNLCCLSQKTWWLSCVYLGSPLYAQSNWRGRQILLVSFNKWNLKSTYGVYILRKQKQNRTMVTFDDSRKDIEI